MGTPEPLNFRGQLVNLGLYPGASFLKFPYRPAVPKKGRIDPGQIHHGEAGKLLGMKGRPET
jgi:hypothetical protein